MLYKSSTEEAVFKPKCKKKKINQQWQTYIQSTHNCTEDTKLRGVSFSHCSSWQVCWHDVLMSSCSLTGISDERTLCFWKLNIQFRASPDLRRPEPPCCRAEEGCTFPSAPLLQRCVCVCGLCRISRCKCGGSRWLRKRRCTWGTSSDACRSASWRTRSRKRGSTWSAPHPSPSSCSRDTWDGPAGGKKPLEQKRQAGNGGHTNVFKSLNGKFEMSTFCAQRKPK